MFYDFIFVLKISINFPVSLGKINHISLMQLRTVLLYIGTGMQGELNKAESQAVFSARLFSKQAMFFSLKNPLLIMLSYHVTSPTTYSATWLPIFPFHLPGLFIQTSELSSPDSNHRVGWPVKHSHSKWSRLAAHLEVVIRQKSLLHLLCWPRESQLGRKFLEETHFQIQEVVCGLQGAPWACLP